jgi:amino acid permease
VSTGLTVAQICAGVGLLALPYAFILSGFLIGIVGVVIVAYANYVNTRWLVEAKDAVLLYGLYRRGADLPSRAARVAAGAEASPLLALSQNQQQAGARSRTPLSAASATDASSGGSYSGGSLSPSSPTSGTDADVHALTLNLHCTLPDFDTGSDTAAAPDADAVAAAAATADPALTAEAAALVTAAEADTEAGSGGRRTARRVALAAHRVAVACAGGPLAHLSTDERAPADAAAAAAVAGAAQQEAEDADELSSGTFGFVARAVLGRHGPLLVDISLLLTLLGCATLYFITLGHMLSTSGDSAGAGTSADAVPAAPPAWWQPSLSPTAVMLLAALLQSPLSLIRDLSHLSWVAVLGIASYSAAVVAITAQGLTAAYGANAATGPAVSAARTLWGDLAGAQYWSVPDAGAGSQSLLLTVFQFLGMVAFSFGIPALAFDLESAMAKPMRRLYGVTMAMTTATVSVLYAVLGVLLAVVFSTDPTGADASTPRGAGVAPLVLLSLKPSAVSRAVTAAIAVTMLCALTPTLLTPALNLLETLVFGHVPAVAAVAAAAPDESAAAAGGAEAGGLRARVGTLMFGGALPRALLRLSVTWACALVAIGVPCFSLIMAIVGSGSVGLVCFVLPPLFLLLLARGGAVRKTPAQLALLHAMLAFGVVACLSSLWVGATGECT